MTSYADIRQDYKDTLLKHWNDMLRSLSREQLASAREQVWYKDHLQTWGLGNIADAVVHLEDFVEKLYTQRWSDENKNIRAFILVMLPRLKVIDRSEFNTYYGSYDTTDDMDLLSAALFFVTDRLVNDRKKDYKRGSSGV